LGSPSLINDQTVAGGWDGGRDGGREGGGREREVRGIE